jgi:HD-like signal output (HDOD) protein
MQPFTEEERQKADIIFNETLGKVSLGFDPGILKVLDDPESSEKEREEIKQKLSQEIVAHLMQLANSAYLGKITVGKLASFAAVILRLGTIYVKIFIIGFALFSLAKDERSKTLLAKSFSAAIVGKLLAEQLNWQKEYVQQEIGRAHV